MRFHIAATARANQFKPEIVVKSLPPFIPHNPLISLDSDERIQGNPKESNSGFGLIS
jgi:hypothetical protein